MSWTLLLCREKGLFTRPSVMNAVERFATTSLSMVPFHHPQPQSKIPANSNDIRAHYSFDYAQQVHFPSNPLQPGPIFLLTPRKCSIFGVNCEALPRQINFLTDEAGDCGKGANTVTSEIHFFLLSIMALTRKRSSCMPTAAPARTKIVARCTILCGGA